MKNFNDYLIEMEDMRTGIEVHNEGWSPLFQKMRGIYKKFYNEKKITESNINFYIVGISFIRDSDNKNRKKNELVLDEMGDNSKRSLLNIYGKDSNWESMLNMQSLHLTHTLNNWNTKLRDKISKIIYNPFEPFGLYQKIKRLDKNTTWDLSKDSKEFLTIKEKFNFFVKEFNSKNEDLDKILIFWKDFPKVFLEEDTAKIIGNKTYQKILDIKQSIPFKAIVTQFQETSEKIKDIDEEISKIEKRKNFN